MPVRDVVAKAPQWLAEELGLKTMAIAGKDVYLLILARYLRLFAYGAVALVLALYFEALGFSDERIGLFMTLTLLGDVIISLLLTLVADKLGRRRTLLLGALMMTISGAVFATTNNYVALLMAAIIGVISPSGNEIGPFRAVEESTLAHLVPESRRSDVYAWYVVLAVLGTSTGLVVGGVVVERFQGLEGWNDVDAYRALFWIYTGIGCVKAVMTFLLSSQCESDKEIPGREATIREPDEQEPLLIGHDRSREDLNPPGQSSKRFNLFSTISPRSRWILLKLCSLFFFDSLGSGMVPFSLVNFYMDRKFHLKKSKLGSIMSATWFVSTIGNIFASSLAKRIGLIQAMVCTHLPSSIFLALLPVPPSLQLTICLLVGRAVLNSMDQAPRSAFLSLVVLPAERTSVMGIVNIVKTLSQSGGPVITGFLAGDDHFWVAFVVAGSMKAAYDLALLTLFAGKVHKKEQEPGVEEPNDNDEGDVVAHNAEPKEDIPVDYCPLDRPYASIMAPALVTRPGKILYLDAYDSFSNNIVALIEQCLDAKVVTIRIDDPRFTKDTSVFRGYLKNFDAVIAGPGPGTPTDRNDVGLMQELWRLEAADSLPVLGICLGFQSMVTAFGAEIEKLVEPRHGLIAEILHKGRSIFKGVDQLLATQYHSLQANIGHAIQTKRAVRNPGELWKPTEMCPELEPLAWDFENRKNGAVLMATRHTQKPFWGVQFHPESICTNSQGVLLIQNWWIDAQAWIPECLLNPVANEAAALGSPFTPMTLKRFHTLLGMQDMEHLEGLQEGATLRQSKSAITSNSIINPELLADVIAHGDANTLPNLPPDTVHCHKLGSGQLSVNDVCDLFNIPQNEAIVLESCLQSDLLPLKVGTGRYSIIGLIIPGETLRLHYYTRTQKLQLRTGKDELYLETEVCDVWAYIKAIMQYLKPTTQPAGPTFAPFWGGLMGYVSYEAGLETIGVEPPPQTYGTADIPDICFAYITRSVVMDHKLKKIYIQSIRGKDDHSWVFNSYNQLYDAVGQKSQSSTPTPMPKADPFDADAVLNQYINTFTVLVTSRSDYCNTISRCQESIAKGDSYELCLTSQNEIRALYPRQRIEQENNELSWKLYKRLKTQNPAPFSAYLRLHNIHVLSSSPERYISWDRNGCSQCRPIKGTVKKRPGITSTDAEIILSSSKERAENLMIVDLVRHQLHGVYGSGNVHVRQLMEIEEYETLWQLVSVIDAIPTGVRKARTPEEWDEPQDYVTGKAKSRTANLGFEAFVKSLPPGSMTGAPKKRSCEILKEAEKGMRRGIYSGVLGYLDVGGGGDFSVVIRTAVKVDGDKCEGEMEVWRIGAGGAITAQSTPNAEFVEMLTKFQSTAAAFQVRGSKLKDFQPSVETVGASSEEELHSSLQEWATAAEAIRGFEPLSIE
ncbi:para-aminobenzoate synthase [Zopfia rhizophila CBS 207.26]|uniref:p-aminobenzoic acid synthase n=1 Tax=Zopfia rhizophila CBS 207.26 TaxID=1314779 RepID=A0A6A6DXP6_9PEZI|nr:para-aminobenzoate synthase [Zopfia rhizophila CBS 207.26]